MKLLLIVLLLVTQAQAEPDSAIRYLMKTPVNALDFGLYKMEMAFEHSRLRTENKMLSMNLLYNDRKNEISISAANPDVPISEAKEYCKKIIIEIKSTLAIDHSTGKGIYKILPDGLLALNHFPHNGPRSLPKALNAITTISVGVGPDLSVKCNSDLLSTEIFFAE